MRTNRCMYKTLYTLSIVRIGTYLSEQCIDPDMTPQNAQFTLLTTHLAVLDVSTGGKMD